MKNVFSSSHADNFLVCIYSGIVTKYQHINYENRWDLSVSWLTRADHIGGSQWRGIVGVTCIGLVYLYEAAVGRWADPVLSERDLISGWVDAVEYYSQEMPGDNMPRIRSRGRYAPKARCEYVTPVAVVTLIVHSQTTVYCASNLASSNSARMSTLSCWRQFASLPVVVYLMPLTRISLWAKLNVMKTSQSTVSIDITATADSRCHRILQIRQNTSTTGVCFANVETGSRR